jgi:hypothetical protein
MAGREGTTEDGENDGKSKQKKIKGKIKSCLRRGSDDDKNC